MIVMSHSNGNANVRAAAHALAEAGLLDAFYTTVAITTANPLFRLLPTALVEQFHRRSFDDLPPNLVRQWPWRELVRQLALRLDGQSLVAHEAGWASVDEVVQSQDRRLARLIAKRHPSAMAIYAYEDGARILFRKAKQLGLRCIYELPIADWRSAHRILTEERDLSPEWANTLEGYDDSQEKLARKDEEVALADDIIVPSLFVKDGLVNHPAVRGNIHVVPYGGPMPLLPSSTKAAGLPLRVLFVGQLRQRKGLSYLFEAVRKLDVACELTLIGSRPPVCCAALDRALSQHIWIPAMPHARLLEHMSRYDVMVFPSLCEGLALVIAEARSRGLPVITTYNAGGTMVIEDGVDGFIVPIRDADAIAERLTLLAEDRTRLAAMSEMALAKAAAWRWETIYERPLVELARRILQGHPRWEA